jgi:hypothetical protein
MNVQAALAVNYSLYTGFTVMDCCNSPSAHYLPVIIPITLEVNHIVQQ